MSSSEALKSFSEVFNERDWCAYMDIQAEMLAAGESRQHIKDWLKEVVVNRQHISASADEIIITMRDKPNAFRSPANDQSILNLVNDRLGLPYRTLKVYPRLTLVVLPALLLICFTAFTSGCAVRQPKLSHPVAQYSIPLSCLDGVAAGTKATRCEALPKVPGNPDQAKCDHIIVNYHCTKVVQ